MLAVESAVTDSVQRCGTVAKTLGHWKADQTPIWTDDRQRLSYSRHTGPSDLSMRRWLYAGMELV